MTRYKIIGRSRKKDSDAQPEIGQEAALFETGLVNASMIPDAFGYQSLGENRKRISELEEYSAELLQNPDVLKSPQS